MKKEFCAKNRQSNIFVVCCLSLLLFGLFLSSPFSLLLESLLDLLLRKSRVVQRVDLLQQKPSGQFSILRERPCFLTRYTNAGRLVKQLHIVLSFIDGLATRAAAYTLRLSTCRI